MAEPTTRLRQRMIDDMRMRNLSPLTQAFYVRSAKNFAAFHPNPIRPTGCSQDNLPGHYEGLKWGIRTRSPTGTERPVSVRSRDLRLGSGQWLRRAHSRRLRQGRLLEIAAETANDVVT
jgi:hypothetical protein